MIPRIYGPPPDGTADGFGFRFSVIVAVSLHSLLQLVFMILVASTCCSTCGNMAQRLETWGVSILSKAGRTSGDSQSFDRI